MSDLFPVHFLGFIANVYGMPAIGRFFAMPKMKKYPHRIMLADAEGLLDEFPQPTRDFIARGTGDHFNP